MKHDYWYLAGIILIAVGTVIIGAAFGTWIAR